MGGYDRDGGKWNGIERALREQMIKEGNLAPDADAEAVGENATLALEVADEFTRTFTEERLGIALNVGHKGRIIVKRCVEGTPAARRRIPPGAFVTKINDTSTDHKSLQEVQEMIKSGTRPLKIDFSQSESSKAIAENSRKVASKEVQAQKEAHAAMIAARKAAEIDRMTTTYETAETFSRTFTEERLGICLGDPGQDEDTGKDLKGKTFVSKCLPGSPAFKSGVPPDVLLVAINGKSLEFRRFKEVKKLLQMASRPVTIDFSAEEVPTFPLNSGKTSSGPTGVPGYAFRPL